MTLDNAFLLVSLYVATDHPKGDGARVRWLARLLSERDDLTLDEVRRAGEWLEQLARPDGDLTAGSLAKLVHRQ